MLLDFAAWLEGRPWAAPAVSALSETSQTWRLWSTAVRCATSSRCLCGCRRIRRRCLVRDRGRAANAPIVALGSEGQHEIIAASLERLLAKIALQRFEEDGEWTDFTPHKDVDDATDELADWLANVSA